jgi:hypothetical protein
MDKRRAVETLGREWAGWQQARLATLVRAEVMILAGTLAPHEAAAALGVAEATLRRWRAAYGLRELARACVADVDAVLRAQGATDATGLGDVVHAGVDVEGALGGIGVWRRG